MARRLQAHEPGLVTPLEALEDRKFTWIQMLHDLGHSARYWDTVNVGDELPERVFGPHSIVSFTTEWRSWLINTWGALSCRKIDLAALGCESISNYAAAMSAAGFPYEDLSAAEAMRRILVETARRKKAEKHGGGWQRQELIDSELAVDSTGDDLFAVAPLPPGVEAPTPPASPLRRWKRPGLRARTCC